MLPFWLTFLKQPFSVVHARKSEVSAIFGEVRFRVGVVEGIDDPTSARSLRIPRAGHRLREDRSV